MSIKPSGLRDALELQQTAIASEIHDSLLPYLFATRMRLESLVSRLDDVQQVESLPLTSSTTNSAFVRDEMTKAIATLEEAMQISRHLIHELYPVNLAQTPWSEQLVATVDPANVALVIEGDLDALVTDYDCRIAARRIAQEAIRNAVRHGHATTIVVSAKARVGQQVELSIQDDGAGFDTKKISAGYGLRIMRSRAELIGASLTVDSQIGGPTQVLLVMDCHEATGAD